MAERVTYSEEAATLYKLSHGDTFCTLTVDDLVYHCASTCAEAWAERG